jgi:ribosomal protein S18 acetylase RimI-like enzyme
MVDLVVTYLEMTAPPQDAPRPTPRAGLSIARERLDREPYLALYRAVGAPWQWDQRLCLAAETLCEILARETTHIYVLRTDAKIVGFCEFEDVGDPDVELVNFGLILEAQGRGLGPYFLDQALRRIWSYGPRRVWLHTDANDHPKALATYQRAGFRICDRRLEHFPD